MNLSTFIVLAGERCASLFKLNEGIGIYFFGTFTQMSFHQVSARGIGLLAIDAADFRFNISVQWDNITKMQCLQ